MTRRLLPLVLTAAAFGACNCDEELYATPGDLVGVLCFVEDGKAMVNVPVVLTDSNGNVSEITTDGTGLFREEKMASGMATITVNDPIEGERTFEIEILPNREVRFEDEACHPPPPPPDPAGVLIGRVCDETAGQWVAGANVFVITELGSIFSTGTEADGSFRLTDVPVGDRVLEIQKGGFYEQHAVFVEAGVEVNVVPETECEPPVPPGDVGSIEGRVCAPDGITWLGDATVYVENPDGTRAQDLSDAEGRFRLDNVPVGDQTVNIEKGSFTTTRSVTVAANTTTVIPDDECQLEAPDVTVAVVTGSYDRVQDVLANIGVDQANITTYAGNGFPTTWVADLLEDFATLSQYDIVFLNCGLSDLQFTAFNNQTAIDNLRQFVANGGSVYASDWAYSVVEAAWPESIDFYGDDGQDGAAKEGAEASAIIGTIIDAQLAAGMGGVDIELHYPLLAWVPVQTLAAGGTIYIQGDAPIMDGTELDNVPHTVGFNSGAGRVIYTSFHQEPGISLDQERVLQLLMFEL